MIQWVFDCTIIIQWKFTEEVGHPLLQNIFLIKLGLHFAKIACWRVRDMIRFAAQENHPGANNIVKASVGDAAIKRHIASYSQIRE